MLKASPPPTKEGVMKWLRTAGLLLAAAGFWPHGAWAQTEPIPVTLVENTGQTAVTNGPGIGARVTGDGALNPAIGYNALAQPFTTGASAGGYDIESVRVVVQGTLFQVTIFKSIAFVIEIAEGNAAGTVPETAEANVLHRWTFDLEAADTPLFPDTEVDVDDDNHTTPKGENQTVLAPNETYFLIIRYDVTGTGVMAGPRFEATAQSVVDSTSSSGWSMGELSVVNVVEGTESWQVHIPERRLHLDIEGHVVPPPEISISDAPAVMEGDSGMSNELVYTVSIDKAPLQRTTVNYASVAYNTAGPTTSMAGEDFVAADATGMLTWEAGDDTDREIRVRVIGDTLHELDINTLDRSQDVAIMLSAPTGGATLAAGGDTASGTITDDDGKPRVSVSVGSAAEGDSGDDTRTLDATFTWTGDTDESEFVRVSYNVMTLPGLAGEPANQSVAVENTDYTTAGIQDLDEFLDGFVQFSSGERARTISFPIVMDNIAEPDKYLGVVLTQNFYADISGSAATDEDQVEYYFYGTLTDDDRGISIDSPGVDEADSGSNITLTYTVSLDGEWPQEVAVDYSVAAESTATSGTDYVALADGTLTFPANSSTAQTITVTVTGDDEFEEDETIVVRLANARCTTSCGVNLAPTITTADGEGTIRDNDDPRISISNAAAVDEGDSGMSAELVYTVSISAAPMEQVTVNYAPVAYNSAGPTTATSGEDFVAADAMGTLTWEAGDDSDREIRVRIIGDTLLERNSVTRDRSQDVAIMLSSPTGGTTLAAGGDTATGTITDDDDNLQVTARVASAAEGDSIDTARTLDVVIAKTGDTDESFSSLAVGYVVLYRTGQAGEPSNLAIARNGIDYTTVGISNINMDLEGIVQFGPTEYEQTLSFPIVMDNIAEPDRYLGISLQSGTGFDLTGGAGNQFEQNFYGTLTDDDRGISIDSPGVDEVDTGADSTLTYTVSLDGEWPQEVAVDYSVTAESTATSGADYVALVDGTLRFPANNSAARTITVTVTGDDAFEEDETIIVRLANARCTTSCGANLAPSITTADGTGTIRNNDSPRISISDAPAVDEGDSGMSAELVYTVSIDAAPLQRVTVNYAPVAYARLGDTTAMAGEDFVAADAMGTLTWEAGDDTDREIRVRIIGDTLYEVDNNTLSASQDVAIMLSSPTGGAMLAAGGDTASGTITDDDSFPQITARVGSATEGDSSDAAGTLDVVVSRTGDTDESTSVSASYFIISASGLAGEPANLAVAALDADYTRTGIAGLDEFLEGSIGFGPTEYARTLSFPIIRDNVAEPDKYLGIALLNASEIEITGGTPDDPVLRGEVYFYGTLTDDDRGISIDSPEVTEANTGADSTLTYTVSLDGEWPQEVAVDYSVVTADSTAASGTDYVALADGTLTFPMGSATPMTIPVTVTGDDASEGDETIVVRLANARCTTPCGDNLAPTITTADGEGTIRDNDIPRVSISSPAAVTEGDTTTVAMRFSVRPSAAPDAQETVIWTVSSTSTATAAADYTIAGASGTPLSGQLTFPANQITAQTVTVTVNGDLLHEGDETIVIDLSSPSAGLILDTAAQTGTGTITDNDPAPVLSIGNATVAEGDTGTATLRYTVEKAGQTALPASVSYSVTDGTATSGTDFTAPTGTSLEFAPAETQKMIEIQVTGDNLAEGNETVEITLASPSDATIASGMAVGTGTITDDDPLEFSIDSTQVAEGAAGESPTMTLTISLASDHAYTLTVPYTVEGSATSGTDYQAIPAGPLVFASGERSKTVTVTVTGDDDSEPSETVEIVLGTPSCTGCPTGLGPSIAMGMARGVGTIANDDSPLLSIDSPSVTEGDAGVVDLTFTVTLTPAADDQTVTVSYGVTGGTATAGDDYTAPTGSTLTFQPTVTTQTFTISVAGDEIYEGDETVIVALSNQTEGIELATAPGTGTITDDDPMPVFAIDSPSVSEGDTGTTDLTFTVTKTGATALPATVSFAVADGTATVADSDYTAPSDTSLDFAPADTTLTVTVSVTGDSRGEEDETLTVTLSNATGATIGTAVGTGTILDDDPLTLSIDSPSVLEGDSGTAILTFEVTLASPPSSQVTVAYSVSDGTATVADGDYVAPPDGTLTFPVGSMVAQTFAVTVNGDTNAEPHETVTVTLSSPTGGAGFAGDGATLMGTGTIVSDDLPLIAVSSPSVLEGRSGTATLDFVVTISQTWQDDVTVAYEVSDGTATAADGDYSAPASATLTFAANTATLEQTITVTVNGDNVSEGDETVTVTLSSPVNAIFDGGSPTLVGTGTILSDDRRLTISSSSEVREGEPGGAPAYLEYTVALTPAAGGSTVEVGYRITDASTATVEADYSAPSPESPLVFMTGETSKTIRVAVNGDYIEEAREFVEIMLVPAEGAVSAAGAVIETERARGFILPRKPSGSSVLSVRPGRVSTGDDGAEPALGLSFEMDPPRTYPVTVQYQVRLQGDGPGTALARDVGLGAVLAGDAGSRVLGVTATVDLAASQGTAEIDHRLGAAFDAGSARNLEVLVEQVLVASSGDPDPNVNISGTQVAVRGGGAVTRVGGADAARLARGLGYVLAGAGRSFATGLVDALWERAAAHRSGSGESLAVLGGRAIDTAAFAPGTDASRAAREVAGLFGVEAVAPSAQYESLYGSAYGDGLENWQGAVAYADSYYDGSYGDGIGSYREWAGLPDSGDAVRRSRFALSFGGSAVGSITAWGRGDIRSYESDLADSGFSSEGDTVAWLFGVDYRYQKDIVVGVAVSRLSGETDYVFDENEGEGAVETGLTSFAPWVHWTGSAGYEAWGSIGVGSGTATVDEGDRAAETDVTSRILAAGVRGREMSFGQAIVAAKADAYRATLTSSAAGGGLQVADADGNSSRVRLAVEASRNSSLDSGVQLAAGLDIGARFDGGAAESGMGADVALDLRYAHPANGIEVTWRSSWLLFHGQDGYKESAFSLGIAFDPGISGLGFHMSLKPSWNAAHLGGGSLWDSGPTADVLDRDGDGTAYRARLGYGLEALRGRALATAYGEVDDGGEEVRMRLGADLRNADTGIGAVRLGLYGERENSGAPDEDDTIMLEGRVGF